MRKIKMKITMLTSLALIIALSFVAFKFNSIQQEKGDSQKKDALTIDTTKLNPNVETSASYIDGSENLDEMLQNADIIVKGTASKIEEERQLGILFSFDIEKVIKGNYKNNDTITVLTLKGEDQLNVGQNYVLALDHDNYYDENTYHIMSGYQGLFSLKDKNVKYKETKFKNDIDQIMSDENNTDLSPLDTLFNGFSDRIKELDLK
jgi:hypothetical protein